MRNELQDSLRSGRAKPGQQSAAQQSAISHAEAAARALGLDPARLKVALRPWEQIAPAWAVGRSRAIGQDGSTLVVGVSSAAIKARLDEEVNVLLAVAQKLPGPVPIRAIRFEVTPSLNASATAGPNVRPRALAPARSMARDVAARWIGRMRALLK